MHDAHLAADIHGQPVIFDTGDACHALSGLANDIQTLVHVEEPAFVLVDTGCHDDFVEHRQRTPQDIQMAGSKGIEGSGKQSDSFHYNCQLTGVLP